MPWYVDIIESEAGCGSRVDDTVDFGKDHKAALAWMEKYNLTYNNEPTTPSWYMRAGIPYRSDKKIKGAVAPWRIK